MAIYDELRVVAADLITEFGRTVTLTKIDRAAADAAKPWRGPATPGTPIALSVTAVLVPFMTEDGKVDLTRRGRQQAYVAAATAEAQSAGVRVEQFDTLTEADGTVWKIHAVDIIAPGPSHVLYTLEVEQ